MNGKQRAKVTRKQFLGMVAGISAVALVPLLRHLPAKRGFLSSKKAGGNPEILHPVRIAPMAGVRYSASFLALCQHARFETAEAALRAVRNRRTPFVLRREDLA